MKTHLNLSPAEYETRRAGHLEQRRCALVKEAIAAQPGGARHVLELGSGTGKLLADVASTFPAIQFHGVDVDERMVAYAQGTYRAPNLRYSVADITRNGYPQECDFVYSIDVIHHLHDHLSGFVAVRNALRDGGSWLAVEPNIWHPYVTLQQERMKRAGLEEEHLRPWVVEPLFREAGLAVASSRYHHLFPASVARLPAPLERLERRLERFRFLGGSVVYRLVRQSQG